jgi:hypothetical protein
LLVEVKAAGGNDILVGSESDAPSYKERFFGQRGWDQVWGGRGEEFVRGGRDSDVVYTGCGADVVVSNDAALLDGIHVGFDNDAVCSKNVLDRVWASDRQSYPGETDTTYYSSQALGAVNSFTSGNGTLTHCDDNHGTGWGGCTDWSLTAPPAACEGVVPP